MWNRNLLLKVKVAGNIEVGEKRVKEQYHQAVRDPKVKGKHKPIQKSPKVKGKYGTEIENRIVEKKHKPAGKGPKVEKNKPGKEGHPIHL